MNRLNESFIKNLVETYNSLGKLEFFIAGYCSAITSVSADIILKFLSKVSILQDPADRQDIHSTLMIGKLGKAKSLLHQLNSQNFSQFRSFLFNVPKDICKKCGNPAADKEIEYLECCADLFHKECIKNFIHEQIQLKIYPITCPACPKEISSEYIKIKISELDYENYVRNEISHAIETFECPVPTCKHIISYSIETNQFKVQCGKCLNFACLNCGVKFHENLTCDEYLSIKNRKCEFCGLMMKRTGLKIFCVCSAVVCGICSLPSNLCKCKFRKGG
jgi:hypothetical protein